MSAEFWSWLNGCQLIGPQGLQGDLTPIVRGALDRLSAFLADNAPGVAPIDAAPTELERYPMPDAADAWALYLFYAFHARHAVLPPFNPRFINRYSLNKTVAIILPHAGLPASYSRPLRQARIILASELLHRCLTRTQRQALAASTGIPSDNLLRLVKACDICRMLGMMGKTLQRSLALGYDSLPVFRRVTPDALRTEVQAYLARRGERTSAMIDYGWYPPEAQALPDLIDYA
jgi:hypothetical protein